MSALDQTKDETKPPKKTFSSAFLLRFLVSMIILGVVVWQLGPLSNLLIKNESLQQSTFVSPKEGTWRFIVSGDSRNCGDVVMPAIAAQAMERYQPSFYWHLGDLRAIYKIDEDMAAAAQKAGQYLSCESYHKTAWQDFIDHQIVPFGTTRFYLGIGNHEVIPPKSAEEFSSQFRDWLLTPRLLMERQDKEEIAAAKSGACQKIAARPYLSATPYYHWARSRIDFIYLDNSSGAFPSDQLDWFDCILERAHNILELALSWWACMKPCRRVGRATMQCATTRSKIPFERNRAVTAASMFTTRLWSSRRQRTSTYLPAIPISI